MLRFFSLLGALTCLVWVLVSCGNESGHRKTVIAGPVVHPEVRPIWQKVDLKDPPASAIPPRWKPGDPTIDPGDARFSAALNLPGEGWFRRLLRSIRCTIFSCESKSADTLEIPREPTTVTAGLNINGIAGTGLVVPDPVGDIGPEHYVQAVNSAFQVFDKKTGATLTSPLYISYLWEDTDSVCENSDPMDPIVRFDRQGQRWLISGFVNPSSEYMCIAVSEGADPTGENWHLYEFKAEDPVNHHPFSIDFPKFSVWADAYYLSTVEGAGQGLDVWAFQRSRMLAGQSVTPVRFHLPAPDIALLPGDPDGPQPPAGSPGWFARQVDGERVGNGGDRVEVYAFSVDWTTPEQSTFVLTDSLTVDPFDSIFCTTDDVLDFCIPQPDSAQKLETLGLWPQWRLQYRNFGDHESLLFNHTIDVDGNGHAGIRWYELRRPPDSGWTVAQQGLHYDEDLYYFMGSISMDGKGNIALGYTASNASVFPGIRIAHRIAGDPPGSMPGAEYVAVEGAGSQTDGNSRWGDYSSMDVDPEDDCTFWYTNEYYETSSKAGWSTRIISFKLPGCD